MSRPPSSPVGIARRSSAKAHENGQRWPGLAPGGSRAPRGAANNDVYVQPRRGDYVNTWRIRPVCVVDRGLPRRVEGGLALWPGSVNSWAVVACTLLVVGGLATAAVRLNVLPTF